MKVGLAILLMAFSVVASAGSMKCLFGLSMEESKPVAAAPMKPGNCCPEPEPVKPAPTSDSDKCCCIDTLKKSVVDQTNPALSDFRIDFEIIAPESPEFTVITKINVPWQPFWPDVHGPPGPLILTSESRAPPVG